MAANLVAEQKGSARSQAFTAKVLEVAVALLSRASGCFVMGSTWAQLRLKALTFF